MAKKAQFKAYDLNRKKSHEIASPPVKLRQSRLDAGEWAAASKNKAAGGSKSGRVKKTRGRVPKTKLGTKLPKRAMDVLRCVAASETVCLYCGKFGDDASCGARCYREFKKQFVGKNVDIKGPGPLGYGAFTKPGVTIAKGQYLDEYIGDLHPSDSDDISNRLYRFEIPGVCAVDAEQAGNWTRFINSHCRPNVKPWADFVGGRHVIVFQALKDIGPEEEILFNYGKKYFDKAGFACDCNAHNAPHMPGQHPGKSKESRGV